MKGTTNAQRNAVVDSSYANNQLKLTYADGSVDTHTLASPIVIDDALSSTSTNPVQNKVVKGALDGKLGKTETAAKATADADGNAISTTYLKSATASTTYLKQTDASGTYLKKTDAASTYATQDALASAIGSVYRYKNSVTNYSDLPTSGNTVGDVYNVVNAYGNVPAGTNWAWNGSAWDALAGTVDLSPYAKATEVANTYATQTALNNGLAGKQNTLVVGTNLDSAPASGSTNPVTSGGVYSAINGLKSQIPTGGTAGQVWASNGSGAGKWANVVGVKHNVTASSWVANTTYSNYGYRCAIAISGVTASDVAEVVFNIAEATSGKYAPICDTYAGGVYLYSKTNTRITIPTITVMKGVSL